MCYNNITMSIDVSTNSASEPMDDSVNNIFEPNSLLQLEIPVDDHENDIDDIIQQSPVPDHILERPSSPITVMVDPNDDLEVDVIDNGFTSDVPVDVPVNVPVDVPINVPVDVRVKHDETNSLLGSTMIGITNSIKKELLEEFSTIWSDSESPLNKSILIKILVHAMEIVEKTDIKGRDQQDAVINVLVEILDSDIVVSPHKETMLAFLKEDAGDVITLIVDASKGKININKLQGIAVRLFKKISGCFA